MDWTEEEEENDDKSQKSESEEEKEKIEPKSESEEEESDKKVSRILTTKEKIIESLKSIYNSINSGIKSQSYKTIYEKAEELNKNIERVLSNFTSEEINQKIY